VSFQSSRSFRFFVAAWLSFLVFGPGTVPTGHAYAARGAGIPVKSGVKAGGGPGFTRGGPPRGPGGNYLPDPAAEGAHTTLGTRTSHTGQPYRQGSTFDANGNFLVGRTEVDFATLGRGNAEEEVCRSHVKCSRAGPT
jgi:hypothetical protein